MCTEQRAVLFIQLCVGLMSVEMGGQKYEYLQLMVKKMPADLVFCHKPTKPRLGWGSLDFLRLERIRGFAQ